MPLNAQSQAPWGPWLVHLRPQLLSSTPCWTWRNSSHLCPHHPTTLQSTLAVQRQMHKASPIMAPWIAQYPCILLIAPLLMRPSWGCEETARPLCLILSFTMAPVSVSGCPPLLMCPWTVGPWCCQPLATSLAALAHQKTHACWNSKALCAPSITCSSAPSSAAAQATALAWTAASGVPLKTVPCLGDPHGLPAPIPAQLLKPHPHWVLPQLLAVATGWRAGRPGWDLASPS